MTGLDPPDAATVARATAAADRIDRYLKRTLPIWILMIPVALVAGSDLVTGWVGNGRRIDLLLLAASTAGIWALFSTRRMARRIRSGELRRRPTRRQSVRAVGSMIGSYLFVGAMGYIVGGWLPAMLLLSGAVAFTALAMFRARTRVRRHGRNLA